jgi:hypothetical protein
MDAACYAATTNFTGFQSNARAVNDSPRVTPSIEIDSQD